MKRLISILLTVVMLASMLVAVIPASAATVSTETTDKPLTFKSGFNNVWAAEKQVTALPKTLEATIDVPTSADDQYWGNIMAWNDDKGDYIVWDLRDPKDGADKNTGVATRFLVKNNGTGVTLLFRGALEEYRGQKVHVAITVGDTVKLYVNGTEFTGTVNGNVTQAATLYNGLTPSNLRLPSIGGDFRGANSAYNVTNVDNYRWFRGKIYNVCAFSDIRSATEIAADKDSFETTADNIMMAYDTTNIEDGEKVIADLTGNGYNLKRTFYGKSFTSGFDNLYSSKKQVTTLPKTLEATIELPDDYSDQYWGNIFAWGTYSKAGYDEILWDVREDTGSQQIETRFLVELDSGEYATIRFVGALESYRGGKVHLAIVIDNSTVKLYINGTEWNDNVTGDLATAASLYNQVTISKLPMPSIGGDFRDAMPDSKYAVHHVDNFRWFRGKIFDFCAFTDARTTDEINADKTTLPVQGADKLLMSYNLFDETDARFIPDKSGNKYDMMAPLMWIDSADKVEITDYGYSFAVVGDTQVITRDEMVEKDNPYYNENYKGSLAKLYDWIVNNAEKKNIQFSFHMGDVTDWNNALEWNLAIENISKLNGIVPNNIARGNHDQGPTMASRYTTAMFESSVKVGEEFGYFDGRGIENYNVNTLNTYQTITVGDVMYLMIALDLGPCKAVIEWANEVIKAHPYHNVIISTHSYLQGDYSNTNYPGAEHYPYMDGNKDCAANMYNPGGYYGPGGGYGVNWDFRLQQHKDGGDNYLYQDATYMLNNLVKKHDNISMVLCGHECSEYVKQISTTTESGKTVLQFLVDGQGVDDDLRAENGHAGLVAMFYFSEDGKKVTTEYYSTIRDQYLHDSMNVNTYDVNTVTVPASVKAFYTLMHSLKAEDYSAGAWAAISHKLAEVKNIVVTTSDMSAVDAAVAALEAVIENTESLNYSNINNAIANAEALVETDFTVEDWTAIEAAITTAKAALVSDTQDALDNAATALNNLVSSKTKLDRSALNAAIAAVENAIFDYSEEAWSTVSDALDDAKAALNLRTQSEIDAAVSTLTALVANTPKLNRAALNAVIAEAESLDFNKYNDSSWSALIVALMDARTKISSRLQSEIDAAVAALNAAIDGLQELPSADDDGDEIDYEALIAAIAAAEALKEADYTATSWANMGAALVNAKKALTATTQDAVDAAKAALDAAVAALEASTGDVGDDTAPNDTAPDESDEPLEEKGCGSVIAASSVVLATVLALGLGFKKKED